MRSLLVSLLILLLIGSVPILAESTKTADQDFLLGNAYYAKGDAVNATQMYKEAVRLDPNLSDAWNNLAIVLTNQKRYNESLEALDNATRINASSPDTWYNRGVTLGLMGRYDEEVAAYEKALALRPNLTAAWRNIGVSRYEQGKYADAVSAFEKAVSLDPGSATGRFFLGTAYEKAGNLTGAVASYTAALQMDKNMTQAEKKLEELKRNNSSSETPSPSAEKKTPFPLLPVFLSLGAVACLFRRS